MRQVRLFFACVAYAVCAVTFAIVMMTSNTSQATVLGDATSAENDFVTMKLFLTLAGFVSVSLLGVIGFFLQRTLNAIEADLKSLTQQVAANDAIQRKSTHDLSAKMQVVTTDHDGQLIGLNKDMEHTAERVAKIESAMQEHGRPKKHD